ncbi:Glyco_hydro_35 domain-containing protein [Meloidogyne graminicola]|uniref:Beta-galactosidase n=1 Tax=Meloidogyne graminicola TaxID=189291 RepID=A0A8S9ZU46_9BILA|nr:Glyco_hydro_35 domain-containing protein [Meloidogyne graminicola]
MFFLLLSIILYSSFVNLQEMITTKNSGNTKNFSIDKEANVFLMDGLPFRYISGEIHYFRIHPWLWHDRLYKVRAAGLNAVQVYVPWNFHEEEPANFNFAGDRDLVEFLRIAQHNQLYVLLRIGPYVCAEIEFGGLPWWLIKDQANIALRTSNKKYLNYVKRYFNVLLPLIRPLLYKNGGPIIMVQIENEYGSVLCDHVYTIWLRDLVREQLGNDVVLYTTDGYNEQMVRCGSVPGTFPTVDFGAPQTLDSASKHFQVQRKFSGGGPNVNSEFYTTWFSMWGDRSVPKQEIKNVIESVEVMWSLNASFSFYMIHGGTNFGFWNGKEPDGPVKIFFLIKKKTVKKVITSYDYAAPISEEGQITPLYTAIRDWIGTKHSWSNPPLPLPPNRTGVAIPSITALRLPNFIKLLNSTHTKQQCLHSNGSRPLHFELFDKDHAFVWYSSILEIGGVILTIPIVKDHAYIFLDGKFMGNITVCDRTGCSKNIKLTARKGQRIDILVESAGRLTYPLTKVDSKGILSPVLLDGVSVSHQWTQCGVSMDALYTAGALFYEQVLLENELLKGTTSIQPQPTYDEPAIYAAKFTTPDIDWRLAHTFFDSRGWGHGVIMVNGFNVGRYWPLLGPQMTLFVPGAVMRHENFVLLLELTGRQKSKPIEFEFPAHPVYNEEERLFRDDQPVENRDMPFSGIEEEGIIRNPILSGYLRYFGHLSLKLK